MNSLVRQDPWSLMPRLQDEINRLFSNGTQSDSSSATASWIPLVDIHEYKDRFEFYVDAPGVEPDTIGLTLEGGLLTLSGVRSEQGINKRGDEPQYRHTERSHGHFYRRFVLPNTVDSDKVNATGKNGVLTVTIPKQAKAMPRRIEIAA
jgi:HSP20 family protein